MERLFLIFVGCQIITGILLAQDNNDKDFVKGADVGFLIGQERTAGNGKVCEDISTAREHRAPSWKHLSRRNKSLNTKVRRQ